MMFEQAEAVLDYSIDLATALAYQRPMGYVAPWWEFSPVTANLLLNKGITYDHSPMRHDFQPYCVRVEDRWTPIDYSKRPSGWMKPLVRGQETDLIEIPARREFVDDCVCSAHYPGP
jgi:predicted deacetylase